MHGRRAINRSESSMLEGFLLRYTPLVEVGFPGGES